MFGNINNAANELADTLGQSPESAEREAFSREFNVSDFDSFGGDVTAGKFTEIARFKVPADTEYAWGYGRAKHATNQGYLYVDLSNSSPAEVEGTIRFTVESSTGRNTEVVADYDTSRLDASKTNKEQMVPFPEQVSSALATQDAYLVIKFDPNNDETVSSSDSEVIIPATEYDLS